MEQGYRKITEDSIVLSKEQIKHPTDDKVIEFFIKHNAKVRKDTAETIFKAFESQLSLYYPHGQIPYNVFQAVFENLAKQYGVKVEE